LKGGGCVLRAGIGEGGTLEINRRIAYAAESYVKEAGVDEPEQ